MIHDLQAIGKFHVVITRKTGDTIKGRFASPETLQTLLQGALPKEGRLALETRDGRAEVEWGDVKAVFFVKDLDGDRSRRNIRFYGTSPAVQRVWVELTFIDGEVLEGYIENPLRGLNGPGFFVQPTSPGENNQMIFVNKDALSSCQVLGVDLQK